MSEHGDKRALGDEWSDWKGEGGGTVHAGKALYLTYAAAVFFILDAAVFAGVYLITPRLAQWHGSAPVAAWSFAAVYFLLTTLWIVQLTLTSVTGRKWFLFAKSSRLSFACTFGLAFRLAHLMKMDRDRLGHSFVKVSNAIEKAVHQPANEKVLILLPRCLNKEQIQQINSLKEELGIDVAVVGGGEQARKKVRELRPTAVIGVACERDLVAGIKDITNKVSVIGVTNMRPEGPCKNTCIDMNELRSAVEFYLVS